MANVDTVERSSLAGSVAGPVGECPSRCGTTRGSAGGAVGVEPVHGGEARRRAADRDSLRRIQTGDRTTGRQRRSATTDPVAAVLHGQSVHGPMNEATYDVGGYRVIDHG